MRSCSIDGDYFYVNMIRMWKNTWFPTAAIRTAGAVTPSESVDRPAVAVNAYGKGRAIHILAARRYFHRQGYMNTFWFLADVYERIMGLKSIEGIFPPWRTQQGTGTAEADLPFDQQQRSYGNGFFKPTPME